MLLYSQEVDADCTSNEEDLFILWVLDQCIHSPLMYLSHRPVLLDCVYWYRYFHSSSRFFMELNNRIFQTLSEVAGSHDPTLTSEHMRAMGLDPQGDHSFLVHLLEVYGIDVTLVIDNLCCSWAPFHLGSLGMPLDICAFKAHTHTYQDTKRHCLHPGTSSVTRRPLLGVCFF